MTRVRQVYDKLTREVWPHESAEEAELYPSLNQLLGGTDPTAPMSRAHAEIAYQIARLGRLIDDIGTGAPDEDDIADLRGLLYGLHAILQAAHRAGGRDLPVARRRCRQPAPPEGTRERTNGPADMTV